MSHKKSKEEHWDNKIRKRLGYKQFTELHVMMKSNLPMDIKLMRIHNLLERYKAFRSQSRSDYTKESIALVIKDLGNH